MYQMKYDMLGSAIVYSIIDTLAKLKIEKNVIGLLPIIENMPGRSAIKPGDIVTAFNKKTIEIMDTDAEGRLIMADALSYSKKFNPKYLFDFATLTGQASGITNEESTMIISNNDYLCEKATEVGNREYERVLRLPIYKEHTELVKSIIADVKNVNNEIYQTDCIFAGAFLKEFIPDKSKWMHVDITRNFLKNSQKYYPEGCTGNGFRFGLKLVMDL